MAASAWKFYTTAKKKLLTGDMDLNAGTLRWKLCIAAKSAAISNFSRSTFGSLTHVTSWVGNDIRTLSGPIITASAGAGGNTIRFDATARIWTASANTSCLYIVVGISAGAALCWSKLSANTTVTAGNTLTITPATEGIFTLTGGVT